MRTLIIDGNNLIHRTYWTAKNQAKRYDGDISKLHIYFTLNAVYSYVNKFKPTRTICVWDEKLDYQKNTRKVEFEGYKGNRSKDSTPHENNDAIKYMLQLLGIPSIFPRELEADDIVAYICKTYGGSKVIVSVDRDFLQLINTDTILFDPIRKKEFNYENFEEMTKYKHCDWLAVKCLQGDKSDNVPGIKGFGKAKVQKYLDGEVVLTQEQQDIYNMNHSLFSLDKIDTLYDESKYYQDQLDMSVDYDWQAFIYECEEKEFSRILDNRQSWYSLFFLSNRLEQILG